MQNVLTGTISVVQCSSSIGTVWKSSSSSDVSGVEDPSEDSDTASWSALELSTHIGVVSDSWSLSKSKDRWWHTGLIGVCESLLGVVVTALQGVVCAGSKEACSMLETWCMHGVFHKDVGKSLLELLS